MVEPKVRLSIWVQGAQMLSSQECDKNPKEGYTVNRLTVEYYEGTGKSKVKKTDILTFRTRNNRRIRQNININKESYNYMLSTPFSNEYNRKISRKKKVWDTFTDDKKLRMYFDSIVEDLNGVKYTYEILDD